MARALASALSFAVGALLPLIAILATSTTWRIPVTVVAILLALVITGLLSAGLGGAPKGRALVRNVVGGALALAVTDVIGALRLEPRRPHELRSVTHRPVPRTRQRQSWLARDKQREVAAVHCISSGGANKLADLARVVRADYRELRCRGVVGEVGEEGAKRGDGT